MINTFFTLIIYFQFTMNQEKYSLTWHTYSDHLKGMMKELMMNEDFSDVTLVTEDKKQIKANIAILSACSPVFKEMLKKDKNSKPTIYLRGIQHYEMESIIQFVYLGEATFYEERMVEFLDVAKSLEIKQLCNAETESNNEPKDLVQSDTCSEVVEEGIFTDDIEKQPQQKYKRKDFNVNGKYGCDWCTKTYSSIQGLILHKESVHQGVKYSCDKCDYQATQSSSLAVHIKSKHEGVKYSCDQCDYQASAQCNLTRHIKTMHKA